MIDKFIAIFNVKRYIFGLAVSPLSIPIIFLIDSYVFGGLFFDYESASLSEYGDTMSVCIGLFGVFFLINCFVSTILSLYIIFVGKIGLKSYVLKYSAILTLIGFFCSFVYYFNTSGLPGLIGYLLMGFLLGFLGAFVSCPFFIISRIKE